MIGNEHHPVGWYTDGVSMTKDNEGKCLECKEHYGAICLNCHNKAIDAVLKDIRDDFAGQALQGILSGIWKDRESSIIVANACYTYADSMIKQRKAADVN